MGGGGVEDVGMVEGGIEEGGIEEGRGKLRRWSVDGGMVVVALM